jgi:hypothetical protein
MPPPLLISHHDMKRMGSEKKIILISSDSSIWTLEVSFDTLVHAVEKIPRNAIDRRLG